MKNDEKPHAYCEANHHWPSPTMPVTPAFGLIVIGHKAILLPLRLRGKGKSGLDTLALRITSSDVNLSPMFVGRLCQPRMRSGSQKSSIIREDEPRQTF